MYLYIFGWRDEGPAKIGTTSQLRQRSTALAISLPFPARIYRALRVAGDAAAAERAVHHALATERLTGEWFDLSIDDAEHAVQQELLKLGIGFDVIPAKEFSLSWLRSDAIYRTRPRVKEVEAEFDRLTASLRRYKRAGRYSRSFKRRAMSMAASTGNILQTAKALNIPRETLQRWISADRKRDGGPPSRILANNGG